MKAAYTLDSNAALFATSWGRFQILGEHFQDTEFSLIELFVYAMCDSEKKQLEAFTFYIKANPRTLHGLRNKDWAEFARYYNGVNYFKSNYDGRIEAAYETLGK